MVSRDQSGCRVRRNCSGSERRVSQDGPGCWSRARSPVMSGQLFSQGRVGMVWWQGRLHVGRRRAPDLISRGGSKLLELDGSEAPA